MLIGDTRVGGLTDTPPRDGVPVPDAAAAVREPPPATGAPSPTPAPEVARVPPRLRGPRCRLRRWPAPLPAPR
jgi:hypothetical protein